MTRPIIYLSSPGVFRPDAKDIGERYKKWCERRGCAAFWPGDFEAPGGGVTLSPRAHATAILNANLEAIRNSAAVVADFTPFRGPHCDVGVAMEIGYAVALGKPVFGFSSSAGTALTSRIWSEKTVDGVMRDPHGNLVEDFNLPDNLMVVAPLVGFFGYAELAIDTAARFLTKDGAVS